MFCIEKNPFWSIRAWTFCQNSWLAAQKQKYTYMYSRVINNIAKNIDSKYIKRKGQKGKEKSIWTPGEKRSLSNLSSLWKSRSSKRKWGKNGQNDYLVQFNGHILNLVLTKNMHSSQVSLGEQSLSKEKSQKKKSLFQIRKFIELSFDHNNTHLKQK